MCEVFRLRPLASIPLCLLLVVAASAGERASFSSTHLARDVAILSDPAMEGRASGTLGGERAARTLALWLEAAGLEPGGDGLTFFQSFPIASETRVTSGSQLRSGNGVALAIDRDWRPHGGSSGGEVTAAVVFVGHGITTANGAWDDYRGIDARGRIALALDGVPPALGARTVSRLEKLITARQAGAAALLLATDALPELDETLARVRLLSGSVTLEAADRLLAPSRRTTAALARAIAEAGAPISFAVPDSEVHLTVQLAHDEQHARNVIGVLRGRDPGLAREAVVIGAHYDHLGRIDGTLHPGADDNASGTAVVMALARAFAARGGASRTLVFAFFGAEELGLFGSQHYVRNPAVPLDRTVAMVNLDMVGRLGSGKLTIAGVDSGSALRTVSAEVAAASGVDVRFSGTPYGPSDHARFYRAGLPVVFLHTGTHGDYHKPTDTSDRVDAEGMVRVADVAAGLVERLASGPAPQYVAVPLPDRSSTARGGAFFGIVASPRTRGDGLPLAEVLPGSSAERAGIRDGDVLVRFGDEPVNGLEDLRTLLKQRQPGDAVDVVYLRDGEARRGSTALGAAP
jgi:hypothetical protein